MSVLMSKKHNVTASPPPYQQRVKGGVANDPGGVTKMDDAAEGVMAAISRLMIEFDDHLPSPHNRLDLRRSTQEVKNRLNTPTEEKTTSPYSLSYSR